MTSAGPRARCCDGGRGRSWRRRSRTPVGRGRVRLSDSGWVCVARIAHPLRPLAGAVGGGGGGARPPGGGGGGNAVLDQGGGPSYAHGCVQRVRCQSGRIGSEHARVVKRRDERIGPVDQYGNPEAELQPFAGNGRPARGGRQQDEDENGACQRIFGVPKTCHVDTALFEHLSFFFGARAPLPQSAKSPTFETAAPRCNSLPTRFPSVTGPRSRAHAPSSFFPRVYKARGERCCKMQDQSVLQLQSEAETAARRLRHYTNVRRPGVGRVGPHVAHQREPGGKTAPSGLHGHVDDASNQQLHDTR